MDTNRTTTIEKGMTRMLAIALQSNDSQERAVAERFSSLITEAFTSPELKQKENEK